MERKFGMRKRNFVMMGAALLVGLLLEACSQPPGACVISLGCIDDMTKAKCDVYFDADAAADDEVEFFEGLSCVDLGFDATQTQVRGILMP
jgi:hypothetical protein